MTEKARTPNTWYSQQAGEVVSGSILRCFLCAQREAAEAASACCPYRQPR